MKKSELRKKSFGFKYDASLDEFFKKSINKAPMGNARVQLIKDRDHRVGKFYWNEIRIVYGDANKPFLEIDTLNGFKIIIYQNIFIIRPHKQMDDNCYLRSIPTDFDKIEFYGEFDWIINTKSLTKK